MKGKQIKKILIIEDEKPMTRALAYAFSHAGFEASTAPNGKEALLLTESMPFDLIILDLLMPAMDGFHFLEEFRKKNKTTPVIVLTNLSQQAELDRAKKLGADSCLVKSNTPLTKLLAEVEKILT